MKKLIILFLYITIVCFDIIAQNQKSKEIQTVFLDGNTAGTRFDGIGIVNGGGATSVLLKDYPEQQRREIMDMVYKPMFGASVSALLVEIPGDGNSTQGSMPSHSHYRGDYNYERGYTWWILREAKSRNPKLSLDCTAWSAPGWIGRGEFFSVDAADYYVSWLRGLREHYGLEMDAIGCRNEKGVSYDFAKALRKKMDDGGFEEVRLHGFDNWYRGKLDFLPDLLSDSALYDAIDIVSAHTFSSMPVTEKEKSLLKRIGKPLWNSEDHVYLKGFECLIGNVECFNKNYIDNGVTKVVNWYDIAGVYPMEPYSHDPAMLLAWEPWSGHYEVRHSLWGYAHYGQFCEIGWEYIDSGCRHLNDGGTMVTLKNPKTNDYSIIIETKGADRPQTIKVNGGKSLKEGALCVWKSTEQEQFIRSEDINPRKGGFFITVEPNAVYSLSTTRGQQKGCFKNIPSSESFPIPYDDSFDAYVHPEEWGYLPHYTADIIGAFELTERPAHDGQCLRQVVGQRAISWAPEWNYYTIIGDSSWNDYEISADVYLNPGDEAGVMGRVCDVGTGYGVTAKGYYMKIDDKGNCSLVITRGKKDKKAVVGDAEQQALLLANPDASQGGERIIQSVRIQDVCACQWHNLKLRFEGDLITGFVDGTEVLSGTSGTYPKGMAGLIAPLRSHGVSTPYFDNLKINPLGRTKTVERHVNDVRALYPIAGN